MFRQKWNKLVELHTNNFLAPETTIQTLWEVSFVELFGYSKLNSELDSHRSIRIGSIDRVIPDIIIKDSEKDLFIVELKQHNKHVDGGMERQLFSYLKQLRLNMGVLVCNKLYLYDYDSSKDDDKQQRLEISFEKDNPIGIKFLELFSKGNFDKSVITKLNKEKEKMEENLKEMESKITNDYVLELIRTNLLKTYTEYEVETVIKKLNVSVTKKTVPSYQPPIQNTRTEVFARPISNNFVPQLENGLGKGTAILLFNQQGVDVNGIVTFSSLNKSSHVYWANPKTAILNKNWSLILNDYLKKELHLFYIPANSIELAQLKTRADKPYHIDLQIRYNDSHFTDSRSGFNFLNYLVKTIKY